MDSLGCQDVGQASELWISQQDRNYKTSLCVISHYLDDVFEERVLAPVAYHFCRCESDVSAKADEERGLVYKEKIDTQRDLLMFFEDRSRHSCARGVDRYGLCPCGFSLKVSDAGAVDVFGYPDVRHCYWTVPDLSLFNQSHQGLRGGTSNDVL